MSTAGEIRAERICASEERRAICIPCFVEGGDQKGSRSGEGERGVGTHVEGFEVLADFGDELFAPLVALREGRVWSVCLREGEEGKRGAREGE